MIFAPGKCLDDCRCAAQALSAGVLNEMAVQCQAVKSVKFQPYRKQVQVKSAPESYRDESFNREMLRKRSSRRSSVE